MEQERRELDFKASRRPRLRYLLAVPKAVAPAAGWPLVLFLHGAGERGNDLGLVAKHGIPRLCREREDVPFVAASPQLPAGETWTPYVRDLLALLDEVAASRPVDPGRVLLTGVSMGGNGCWYLASRHPDRFAAVAPVCGYGLPSQGFPDRVRALVHTPVWTFHGARDDVVPCSATSSLVEALRACGGSPRFTLYADADHDSWTRTYADPAFLDWLLAQRRDPG
jgi:predicted peptidase